MNPTALQSADIVGASLSLATLAHLAAGVLLLTGTTWAPGRWRLPVTLAAVACLAAGLAYYETRTVWLAAGNAPMVYYYIGAMVTFPAQVLALYFFVATVRTPYAGLFWRLLAVAMATILARWMGEAGLMHPTLGLLIGIVGWLYILGEFYFGRMSEIVETQDDRRLRAGYFWLRLIATVGWAAHPLINFISSLPAGADSGGVAAAYALTDLVNRIAFGLAILAVAVDPAPQTERGRG